MNDQASRTASLNTTSREARDDTPVARMTLTEVDNALIEQEKKIKLNADTIKAKLAGACQIFCVKRGHEIIPKGKFHDRRNDYKKNKEAEGRISISG